MVVVVVVVVWGHRVGHCKHVLSRAFTSCVPSLTLATPHLERGGAALEAWMDGGPGLVNAGSRFTKQRVASAISCTEHPSLPRSESIGRHAYPVFSARVCVLLPLLLSRMGPPGAFNHCPVCACSSTTLRRLLHGRHLTFLTHDFSIPRVAFLRPATSRVSYPLFHRLCSTAAEIKDMKGSVSADRWWSQRWPCRTAWRADATIGSICLSFVRVETTDTHCLARILYEPSVPLLESFSSRTSTSKSVHSSWK